MAIWWSVVAILAVICCGYCKAETEFSIIEEAQVLADQMKKLSSQELGVFTMQVKDSQYFDRNRIRFPLVCNYYFDSAFG
jgi:hypothetical protein